MAHFYSWIAGVAILLPACTGASSTTSTDQDGSAEETSAGQALEAVCPEHSSLTYQTFAQPFFAKYCNGCHGSDRTGSERMNAPVEHDLDTLPGILVELEHIEAVAAADSQTINTTMPPTGTPAPSDEERRQLGEWIACGAP